MESPRAEADEPLPPPSDDIEALVAAQKKRRNAVLVVAAVGVAVLGAGLYAISAQQERKADERVGHAFGGLTRCLLGGPPAEGESPGVRFRRAQLTAMTLSDQERAEGGASAWPGGCAVFAFQLDEGLRDAGRAKGDKDLAHAAAALGKLLKEPNAFMIDLGAPVETVWSLARLENVSPGPAVEAPAAPGRAEPFDADALGRTTPLAHKAFSFKSVFTEPHPGLALHVLVDDTGADAPFLCTLQRTPARAVCAPLPAAITATKQGLRLLGTADEGSAPLIFAGERGSEGIWRADTGELVTRFYAYGGYAAADGFSAVLGWKEKEKELVADRKLKGAPTTEAKLDPPFRTGNPYYSAQMLWDQVMLRGVTSDNRRRLFALSLNRSGAVLGEPVDVGELPEPGLIDGGLDEPPHITGCRTADEMVVRVKGSDNDFMSFRLGGKWTAPVSPEFTGGTLGCSKTSATVTRVEPAPAENSWKTTIRQAHCSSAGCQTHVVRMDQLLHKRFEFAPREGHLDAVDLDGKLLVVWAAGERGGVRMRLARADAISAAPDVVLYDDLLRDGQVQGLSTLLDLKLFSREGFALLMLSTTTGVHALRIEEDGKVTQLEVTRG
jgi:hypothetical protein